MILVVGGTGDLGGRIVRQLLDDGQAVRCLVRPGSDGSALEAAGAEVVAGDLTDAASLRAACDGAHVVVASATAIGRRLAGAGGPTIRDVDEVGMTHLIDAAEEADVARFVFVSHSGLDGAPDTPLTRAKRATESRLHTSGIRSVILRPDAYQEVLLGPVGRFDVGAGKVATFGRGDTKVRWVATDDVAALVAAVAVEPDPPAMVEFGGPEALSRNEAVAVAEHASGRSITVRRVPLPVARLLMKLLAHRNDAVASILGTGVMMDRTEVTWDDAPLRERGITPRSATDWITQEASRHGQP